MNINIVPAKQEDAHKVRASRKTHLWPYVLACLLAPLAAAVAALWASQQQAPEYESEAALIVTFGEEYIARPLAADSESWAPWSDQIAVNAELAILNSETLRDRVIEGVGIDTLLGRLASRPDVSRDSGPLSTIRAFIKPYLLELGLLQSKDEVVDARESWNRSLNVRGVKDASVIYVSYRHPSAEAARTIVDAIIASYMDIRRAIYSKARDGYSASQLSLRQAQFEAAVRDLTNFDVTNGSSGFAAMVDRAVEKASSLEAVIAGLERDIASQLGALAKREVAGMSSGATLSDALTSNAAIAGMRAERDEAERQLSALRLRLQALTSKSVDYAVLNERMESAREAYRKALELSRQVEVDPALDETQFSNVKILQSGSLPRSSVNLPISTLVALSAGLAFLGTLAFLVLFAGRAHASRHPALE